MERDDDEKGFLVDFEEKSWEEPKLSSDDMKRESARKAWEKQAEDGIDINQFTRQK